MTPIAKWFAKAAGFACLSADVLVESFRILARQSASDICLPEGASNWIYEYLVRR